MTDKDDYQIAYERIQQEAAEQTGMLDLSELDIEAFPPEISKLTHLRELDCSGDLYRLDRSPLADLSPLAPLTELETLSFVQTSVADLTPLTKLTLLQQLDCRSTSVADLAPLVELTSLQQLDCSYTSVADLTPLAELASLQKLDCSVTSVAVLAPLVELTSLQQLDCSYTSVADLTPLTKLTSLQKLNCSNTQVADLTPLAKLTSLQQLGCSDTSVVDLAPLVELTSLQQLACSRTSVADLTPLTKLTSLQQLDCSHTSVADLTPLAKLPSLQKLDCFSTSVADLTPLAKLPSLQKLDCFSTSVADLTPLAKLASLQQLDCGDTSVADLTPLAKLPSLQQLGCSYTSVADLTPLAKLPSLQQLDCSHTSVADLTPLAKLPSLQQLGCSDTSVADLTPLAKLPSLQQLVCSNTQVADLTPLAKLTSLQHLNCSRMSVADLTPLAKLTSLQHLDCRDTSVADLTPLTKLENLRGIDVSHSQVRELSRSMISSSCPGVLADEINFREFSRSIIETNQVSSLYLYNSRIPGVPAEILSHDYREDCLPRLRDYFHDLNEQSESIPDVKLIVIGNGQIGKTQICRKLCGDAYDDSFPSTHGIFVRDTPLPMPAGESEALLNIWDFGGQDLYHGTHALFLNSRAIFMIVWTPETEEGVETQEDGFVFRNHPLRYWLDSVKQAASPACPILLVQTQCDKPDADRPIPPVEADYLNSIPNLKIVQYSAKHDRNRDSLNAALRDAVRDLRGDEGISTMGSGRMRVKRLLQKWRSQDAGRLPADRRHRKLTQTDFDSLCRLAGNVSSPASLLDYFHHAGIVFYRKGLFNDQIILDQSWALDAVYTLFHRDKCVRQLQQHRGRFTREFLELLAWGDYSPEEQELFLSMMQSCGICFRHTRYLVSENKEDEYIAPDLLPTREEAEPALAGRWEETADGHERRWTYEFLPPGLIRTVISRIGQAAGESAVYWKYGVWFYEATTNARAILEQTKEGPYAGEILLRTQGDQGELLERITEWVEKSHKTIRHLKFQVTGSSPPRKHKEERDCHDEQMESETLPTLRITDQPREPGEKRLCVSYAWKEELHRDPERAGRVQVFCDDAKAAGFRLIRDTEDARYWDDLREFMRNIAKGDRVYVILSDAYLKSENCMFELYMLWRECRSNPAEFRARLRTYTTDAALLDDDVHSDLIDYWKDKAVTYEERLKKHGFDYGAPKFERGKFVGDLSREFATIMEYVVNTLHPKSFEEFSEAAINELQRENSDDGQQ